METTTVNAEDATAVNNLRKYFKKEQYTKALELCDKILGQNPADIDIYKVKILCCINLHKYDDALEIADFNGEFAFEKAYCLYRKNRLSEAVNVCNSVKSKSDEILHLQGQALHKLQRYEEAAEIYQQLIDSQPATDVDSELYTNLYSASVSAGSGSTTLLEHHLTDSDIGNSFDLMYNIACAQISSGDLHGAKGSLLTASNICHEVLSSEGMTEEEITAESTAIRLQTAFVDILTGHESNSSLEQCKNILRTLKRDNELLAVAANNLAVLRGATDLPDSLRRLRNTISSASEEKLTRSQLMEIRYNRCILLLHLKKIDESLRTLDDLDKMYGVTSRSILIRASIRSLSGAGDEDALDAAASAMSLLPNSSSSDLAPLIAFRAQLLINRGSYQEAESLLSSLDDLKHSPAGISAIYHLKTLQAAATASAADAPQDSSSAAIQYLVTTAEALTSSSLELSDVTRTASLFQISQELERRQCHQEAANVLQAFLTRCGASIDSSERLMANAKLAIALSFVQPAEAEKSTIALPKLDTSSVDARALELGEIPRLQKRSKGTNAAAVTSDTGSAVTAGDLSKDSAAAKKEKSKVCQRERVLRRRAKLRELYLRRLQELGKYDPSRPTKPDPERWIPLKQRSYNKRGRKNRNKFVGGQGSGDGAQKDMQKLDAYARSHGAGVGEAGGSKKQGVVIAAPTASGGGGKKGSAGRKKR